MRHFTALALVVSLAAGCSDSSQDESQTRFRVTPEAEADSANTTTIDVSDDARRIVQRAIDAIGGSEARKLLRKGYVKMSIEGDLQGVTEQFGTNTLTFEAYFDLPDYERRDVYGDPEGEHLLIISNSGTVWVGDQHGKGEFLPAPPKSAYRGPLLVGMLQGMLDVLEDSTRLVLEESDSQQAVVGAYLNNEAYNRVHFDMETGLPTQADKMLFDVRTADVTGPTVLTVTKYSEYTEFGTATLPRRASATQGGKEVFAVRLISADFDSPVDKKHFEIPE